MANTIRIRRRTSGASGAPSSLKNAELAFNEVDETLYYGKGDTSGDATSVLAIAGPGAFLGLTGTQTVTGKHFLVHFRLQHHLLTHMQQLNFMLILQLLELQLHSQLQEILAQIRQ